MQQISLSDLYQLRKSLSTYAVPLSDADFGIFATRLDAMLASLESDRPVVDAQPFLIAEDTPQRRSLLAILWRFVQLDWIQNRFKCINHSLVQRIAQLLFVGMQNATFTDDRIWFGGVSRTRAFTSADLAPNAQQSPASALCADRVVQRRQNSALFFALGLTLIGLYQRNIEEIVSIDVVRQFMANLDKMFAGSPNIFMDALLENDERCLQTLVTLQRIQATRGKSATMAVLGLNVPTVASPDILALSLLSKIHFDPLVVIDWVSSEPELSFAFLKQFSHRLSQLSYDQLGQLCADFTKMPTSDNGEWCHFQIVHQPTKNDGEDNGDDDDDDTVFQFNIEEIHGQQKVRRKIVVPTKMNCAIKQQQTTQKWHNGKHLAEIAPDELCQTVGSFCAELRHKLCTLAKHLHFPEKAICANLQLFLDNCFASG